MSEGELLTDQQCCDLYEEITGRRIKPSTWRGYATRGQAPKPRTRARWDRAEVTAHLQQEHPRGGGPRVTTVYRRPETTERLEALIAATGATPADIFHGALYMLYDVHRAISAGGVVTAAVPNGDGTYESRQITMPPPEMFRRQPPSHKSVA